MSEGQTEDEKKEITAEGQETLDSIGNPIIEAVEAAGLPLDKWIKELVKLTKAKKSKPQKLTGGVIGASLQCGVRELAKSDKESLVLVPMVDNDTRLSALTLIGKATGWVDPDSMALKVDDPLNIIIEKEGDGISVTHET